MVRCTQNRQTAPYLLHLPPLSCSVLSSSQINTVCDAAAHNQQSGRPQLPSKVRYSTSPFLSPATRPVVRCEVSVWCYCLIPYIHTIWAVGHSSKHQHDVSFCKVTLSAVIWSRRLSHASCFVSLCAGRCKQHLAAAS